MSKSEMRARIEQLELEVAEAHRAFAEAVDEGAVLAAMLVRAAREIPEPVVRANLLAELETMCPGATDGLPESMTGRGNR